MLRIENKIISNIKWGEKRIYSVENDETLKWYEKFALEAYNELNIVPYTAVVNGDYLYVAGTEGKLFKLNKYTLEIVATHTYTDSSTSYASSIVGDYWYVTGTERKIRKHSLSNLSLIAESAQFNSRIWNMRGVYFGTDHNVSDWHSFDPNTLVRNLVGTVYNPIRALDIFDNVVVAGYNKLFLSLDGGASFTEVYTNTSYGVFWDAAILKDSENSYHVYVSASNVSGGEGSVLWFVIDTSTSELILRDRIIVNDREIRSMALERGNGSRGLLFVGGKTAAQQAELINPITIIDWTWGGANFSKTHDLIYNEEKTDSSVWVLTLEGEDRASWLYAITTRGDIRKIRLEASIPITGRPKPW